MSVTRAWPVPPASTTIHIIGDLHHQNTQLVIDRHTKAMSDIVGGKQMLTPALHLQVGDLVESGTSAQDTRALAWLAQLPAPYKTAIGNHDLWQGVRDYTAWEAVYGPRNYSYDLGFARLLVVSPDACSAGAPNDITLAQSTLDWLDAQLAAATKDCIVCCHAPLLNTVLGSTSGTFSDPGWPVWSSAEAGFSVTNDTALRAIFAARSRAKVYVSGHTHSPLDAPGFSKLETVGSRQILCVNSSALYYVGRTQESVADPLVSVYLTWASPNIELRYRDHGAGVWTAPRGSTDRVTTYAIPA